MTINMQVKEIHYKERYDRSVIDHEFKNGLFDHREMAIRIRDHEYHYEKLFRMIWEEASWEEQIQLAIKWKANRFFQSYLDEVQLTVCRIIQ